MYTDEALKASVSVAAVTAIIAAHEDLFDRVLQYATQFFQTAFWMIGG